MIGQNLLLAAKESAVLGPVYESVKNKYVQFSESGRTSHNVLKEFPLYRPNSGGSYSMCAPLTLDAINQTFPLLADLIETTGEARHSFMKPAEFAEQHGKGRPEELSRLFNHYGSDKASDHDYYLVYDSLLSRHDETAQIDILELGLGTNNSDVPSHMGIKGRPGASMRSFRDFLTSANVFGADIDKRILFSEERIQTFPVDQTNPDSFVSLSRDLPSQLTLMIDDGLHSPHANLNSLNFFLPRIAPGGAAVIEDIPRAALSLWIVVGAILGRQFETTIIDAKRSYMFVVERKDNA